MPPIRARPAPATLRRAAVLLDNDRDGAVARFLEAVAAGQLHVSTDEHVHPRDILGNAGVRRVCGGIQRHTLIRWRAGIGVAERFPQPIRKINGVEIWHRAQVKRWLEANRSKEER